MSVRENDHLLGRNTVERCLVQVTYDQRRGYIAVAEGLPIITALSLTSLRRQIDGHLAKGVIARLQLDRAARQERDARRHGTLLKDERQQLQADAFDREELDQAYALKEDPTQVAPVDMQTFGKRLAEILFGGSRRDRRKR